MNTGGNYESCARQEDVVSFLYGELKDVEAQSFRSHLNSCAGCRTELNSFTGIHESVMQWRNESIGSLALTAPQVAAAFDRQAKGRSAVNAVREFFNLSPVWMKAAVGFASLLFVIFAALAIADLRETPSPVAPQIKAENNRNSEEQINALVERRVQDELQRMKASQLTAEVPPQRIRIKRNVSGFKSSVSDARRPLTRSEREQLAADLRLIATPADAELRLLDDGVNQ
jgi:short subunit dehydrogenase-like uncharacterized protein